MPRREQELAAIVARMDHADRARLMTALAPFNQAASDDLWPGRRRGGVARPTPARVGHLSRPGQVVETCRSRPDHDTAACDAEAALSLTWCRSSALRPTRSFSTDELAAPESAETGAVLRPGVPAGQPLTRVRE